jgi:hypothetical protein
MVAAARFLREAALPGLRGPAVRATVVTARSEASAGALYLLVEDP